MEDQFDETKDYYKSLGVAPSATLEDIKLAHIQLALRYHPDSSAAKALGFNAVESGTKFHEVTDAWKVLGKTEVRDKYDAARRRLLGPAMSPSSSSDAAGVPTEIPITFNTQKSNFANVQKAASSNWRDIQDKYKTEKWQKMSLQDKKLHRTRSVHSVGSGLVTVGGPVLFALIAGYSYYSWHRNDVGGGKPTTRKWV